MSWCGGKSTVRSRGKAPYRDPNETIIRLHDVGTDNIAVEKRYPSTNTSVERLRTYVRHVRNDFVHIKHFLN